VPPLRNPCNYARAQQRPPGSWVSPTLLPQMHWLRDGSKPVLAHAGPEFDHGRNEGHLLSVDDAVKDALAAGCFVR
jgi:hypothetical protein